eukprot:2158239-Prymnesium_polylepis.1
MLTPTPRIYTPARLRRRALAACTGARLPAAILPAATFLAAASLVRHNDCNAAIQPRRHTTLRCACIRLSLSLSLALTRVSLAPLASASSQLGEASNWRKATILADCVVRL